MLLIDSWTGHCPEVVRQATPAGMNVIPMIIPKGTTGKVQPLDVYGFRIWKNYVQHFSDSVILLDYDLNLHIRNNIIKLQSLVHNQLSSPRYHSLFKTPNLKVVMLQKNQENLRIQWTFPSKHFSTRYVKFLDCWSDKFYFINAFNIHFFQILIVANSQCNHIKILFS